MCGCTWSELGMLCRILSLGREVRGGVLYVQSRVCWVWGWRDMQLGCGDLECGIGCGGKM
jgi:hypothetical protein